MIFVRLAAVDRSERVNLDVIKKGGGYEPTRPALYNTTVTLKISKFSNFFIIKFVYNFTCKTAK